MKLTHWYLRGRKRTKFVKALWTWKESCQANWPSDGNPFVSGPFGHVDFWDAAIIGRLTYLLSGACASLEQETRPWCPPDTLKISKKPLPNG